MDDKERVIQRFKQFASDHMGIAQAWYQTSLTKMESSETSLEEVFNLWVSYFAVISSSLRVGRQSAVSLSLSLGTDVRKHTFKREGQRGKKTNVTKTEVDSVLED